MCKPQEKVQIRNYKKWKIWDQRDVGKAFQSKTQKASGQMHLLTFEKTVHPACMVNFMGSSPSFPNPSFRFYLFHETFLASQHLLLRTAVVSDLNKAHPISGCFSSQRVHKRKQESFCLDHNSKQ
jgi:hypothetical protein